MKHYLSYGPDGTLVGVHTHRTAYTQEGGWPDHFDLHNGREAVSEHARQWANQIMDSHPGRIEGFVAYDCPCPPATVSCRCPNERRLDHVMNDDRTSIVPKPASSVLVDGVEWDGTSEIVRAPGTPISIQFVCAGAPDGATIDVAQTSTPRLWVQDGPATLTFTGGRTEVLTAYAPGHSLSGVIQAFCRYTPLLRMTVLGWQTA